MRQLYGAANAHAGGDAIIAPVMTMQQNPIIISNEHLKVSNEIPAAVCILNKSP
ncbi:hypothetical protein [Chitinimonas sp.]|uniref:hypothetical protein n=1 Tax=Chitinimonas sp. TaxID=1934313 RepID=UPI0035B43F3D